VLGGEGGPVTIDPTSTRIAGMRITSRGGFNPLRLEFGLHCGGVWDGPCDWRDAGEEDGLSMPYPAEFQLDRWIRRRC
jgi:hypothetical protein